MRVEPADRLELGRRGAGDAEQQHVSLELPLQGHPDGLHELRSRAEPSNGHDGELALLVYNNRYAATSGRVHGSTRLGEEQATVTLSAALRLDRSDGDGRSDVGLLSPQGDDRIHGGGAAGREIDG